MAAVENRIFVSNLPPGATSEHVEAHFAQFGQTTDVYIPLVFGQNRHKGIAYVTFAQPDAKEMALNHQSHHVLGQEVSVQHCLAKGQGKAPLPGTRASGDNRIFIQGIGQETTQEEVQAYFAQFGTWSDIFMPKGSFSAGHKGICFISYNGPDSVNQVLQAAPHMVNGTQVTVDIAISRDAKGCGKGMGGMGMGCGKGMGGGMPMMGGMQPDMGALQSMIEAAEMLYQQQLGQTGQMQQGGGYQLPQQTYQPPQSNYGAMFQQQPGMYGQRPPMAPVGKVLPGRLFLTKMSPGLNKDDLQNYFAQFGTLNDVYMPAGKLIAFIGYEEPSVATSVAAMQTHEVKPGCSVCVEPAIERPSGMGGMGGGGGKGKGRYSPY